VSDEETDFTDLVWVTTGYYASSAYVLRLCTFVGWCLGVANIRPSGGLLYTALSCAMCRARIVTVTEAKDSLP